MDTYSRGSRNPGEYNDLPATGRNPDLESFVALCEAEGWSDLSSVDKGVR